MSRNLHRASGNRRLGFLLALATVGLWGFLAIALRLLLLDGMDAFTITWYRLALAAVLLGAFQAGRGQLPSLGALGARGWGLVLVALFGLVGNYVLFVVALGYVPPATAQVVVQLAPMLFLIGSLVVFGESFSRLQWLGLAVLVLGLLLFFNQRLPDLLRLSGVETLGVGFILVASVLWAGYALAQKQLLVTLSSENILLLVYIGATVLLLPAARPGQITELSTFGRVLLAFGIFNTLAAYGCFAEALEHWEASRVSAVISLTPLVTIGVVHVALSIWPQARVGDRLDALGLAGALLVVAGSMMAALGRDAATEGEPLPVD